MKAKGNQPMSENDEYSEIVRKLDELKKDPKKWEAYMSERAEKALSHWRKK